MKRRYLGLLMALVAILLLWQGASMLVNRPALPAPSDAILAFLRLLKDGGLTWHILASASRLVCGTAAALVFALPTGLLMGRSGKADRILFPFVSLFYPIPKIVFMPVIIVLAGIGNAPKILLIALVVFFQLVTVMRDSAGNIEFRHVQSMRSLNATRVQTLRHLILPCCLPGVFSSLRSTLGASVAVLYIAETFSSFSGLGYYISNRMDCREYADMYAGIIALSLLGGALYLTLELLEKRFCKWNRLLSRRGGDTASNA